MSFIAKLKRRNVIRVAAAYLVAGWLIVEVGSALADIFGAPGWVLKMLVGILTVGLPVALLFSWVYELTPEGVKRESQVPLAVHHPRSRPQAGPDHHRDAGALSNLC